MRLHKPIGFYLLLWPCLSALWLANQALPPLELLLIFTLGVILVRSGGCVINDLVDSDFDAKVERTVERPLATNAVSKKNAWILFVMLMLFSFALVLATNSTTVWLSLIALGLLSVYPFTKRFTHAPQLILGLAFAWAIPIAYSASNEPMHAGGYWFFASTVIWAMVYDTMYAMTDMPDDLKIGIKSTAIWFHPFEVIWIGAFQILMLICLVISGVCYDFGVIYYTGVLLVAVLMVRHLQMIKDRDTQKCFAAFLHNHWLGLIVLCAIAISFLLQK